MSSLPVLMVVCAAGIASLAVGTWSLGREAQPRSMGFSALERVVSMTDVSTLPALSTRSQNEALLDCANAITGLNSLAAMYLSDAERAAIVPKCDAMSTYLTTASPSYSYAWYIGALSAASAQDWSVMNQRLALSERTGPTEQWIGELRVALAEQHYAQLDAATKATNNADLAMLVRSDRGIRTIARQYVDDESFRERITLIVEQMSHEEQRKFLGNVRRAAREALGAST